jgi:hypothetical protein
MKKVSGGRCGGWRPVASLEAWNRVSPDLSGLGGRHTALKVIYALLRGARGIARNSRYG